MKFFSPNFGVVFLVVGLVIISHLKAWGEDWVYFESAQDGDTFYDGKGITHQSGNIVKVKVKVVFTKEGVEKKIRTGGKKYKSLSYSLSFIEISCKNKTGRISTVHDYSQDGKTIYVSNLTSNWMPIHTGRIVDKLHQIVCK